MSEEVQPQPIVDIVQSIPTTPQPIDIKPSLNGKDKSGKFVKGHKLAKGNPFAKKYSEFKSAFMKSITKDNMQALGEKIFASAMKGSFHHQKLVLEYLIDKPKQESEVTINQVTPEQMMVQINQIFQVQSEEDDPTDNLKEE